MAGRAASGAGRLLVLSAAAAALAACATVEPKYPVGPPGPSAPSAGQGRYKLGAPYQVGGVWYVPREQPDYDETGVASWYGEPFHLKTTANGEIFDMHAPSAAHTTLPLPSLVEVTNLDNGRKLAVRVNDRGPFVQGRIIDLSREAARELGYDRRGLARVRVRYLGPAPLPGREAGLRHAEARPQPYRIQAGAFREPDRARRAAARLSAVGEAVVEPVRRDGVTVYRVLLPAPDDAIEAALLRDRVAEIGFSEAQLIRAF